MGPPGPAGKVICRSNAAAQVLCTLMFEDGTWESAPAAMRRATLRLTRNGRTYALGKRVLKSGRQRIRLTATRTVTPGTYRLRITVAGRTTTVKVKVRSTLTRGARL